jgi:hypothetical protein
MKKYVRIIPIVLVLGSANIIAAQPGCLKGAVATAQSSRTTPGDLAYEAR